MGQVREQAGQSAYRAYIGRKRLILLGFFMMLIVMCFVSISAGSAGLSWGEILDTLLGGGTMKTRAVVWHVRLPQVAAGIAVGAALALTGCIMQNVLRNPLAASSTLGVSQGASFGAAVAIVYLGAGIQVNSGSSSAITMTDPILVTLCAFLGGVTTTLVLIALSRVRKMTPATMILAGVALSSLFTGATTLVQYFCDDVKIATVVHWTFGNLGRASWNEILLIAILVVLTLGYFFFHRWDYNAMESGVHTAKSLGVPVDRLILTSMVLCTLISSVAVAFVGCINFIGLLSPHMVRKFVGNDHRFLIPGSILMGSVLMLLANVVSRTIVSPTVLPIGALTSFIGAPLFLYMVLKKGGFR